MTDLIDVIKSDSVKRNLELSRISTKLVRCFFFGGFYSLFISSAYIDEKNGIAYVFLKKN